MGVDPVRAEEEAFRCQQAERYRQPEEETCGFELPQEIELEIERQVGKWGDSNLAATDDRWLEIAMDEWNDLKWAVRTRAEVPGHTIAKERAQLVAVLLRWAGVAA